jgi:4-hydroxymandelate oxidase
MSDAPVCLADVAQLARDRLPPEVWDFVEGGSGDEHVLAANRAALDAVSLVPRVLAGLTSADPSTQLAGTAAAFPVAVAPMAYQRLLHPDGELAAATAAHAAGIPFTVSTLSSVSIEDVAATGATVWFQLYWLRDRYTVLNLVRRAERAGATALVLTVDVPIMGRRLRDARAGFTLPPEVTAAHLTGGSHTAAHHAVTGSAVAEHTRTAFQPAVSWSDLTWLRDQTPLPLLLKGILDPADALLAVRAGVDGIVVSNHGGRQFAGAVPSITALPWVVDAVAGQCEVLLDSGIRTGTDIMRALALGAGGVLAGRPILHGLAAGGTGGVAAVLEILRAELCAELLLAGCGDVTTAGRITAVGPNGRLRGGSDATGRRTRDRAAS